jgi:hypothetical protein
MGIKNFRATRVKESSFGVYAWKLPTGAFLGNEDGEILYIPSEEYDLSKMKALQDAATHYGYPDGRAVFLDGARGVTDEEYEEQIDRAKQGLTPDIYDAPALLDEIAYGEQHG